MKILGIEFASSEMMYVAIEGERDAYSVVSASRMTLGGTRDRDSLASFQDAAKTLLNEIDPDLLAIKEKPERGKMQGGAASLKMEAIVIANTSCPVDFVSGRRVNEIEDGGETVYAYLRPALKAALVASR
jgi:hypothetical protein